MSLFSSIEIVEVAPRDGLQNEAVLFSVEDKVSLILRSISAGARRIEAVSFVNPRVVPQMADAEAVMAALRGPHALQTQSVILSGLIVNRRGLDRALAAKVDELNFVVIASETFSQRNQRMSIRDALLELAETVKTGKAQGLPSSVTIAAAFGCPFEGETPLERVVEIAAEAAALGVQEIALADTIGVADPLAVESVIAAVHAVALDRPLRCHFHNTRNTGIANAYAAWRSGVATLDASLGGIGGCPFAPAATGNIATEDTVYMLDRMGVQTGYDLERVLHAAEWLQGKLGKPLPAALGRTGTFPLVQDRQRMPA